MRKYLLLFVVSMIVVSSFAGRVPLYDVPLVKMDNISVDPTVFGLTVHKSGSSGNLVISFYLTGDTDGSEWKTVVAVRTYTKIGFNNWQWINVSYNVYTDPGDYLGYAEFAIPSYNQYTWAPSGNPGPSGDYIIDDSQFYVSAQPVPVL